MNLWHKKWHLKIQERKKQEKKRLEVKISSIDQSKWKMNVRCFGLFFTVVCVCFCFVYWMDFCCAIPITDQCTSLNKIDLSQKLRFSVPYYIYCTNVASHSRWIDWRSHRFNRFGWPFFSLWENISRERKTSFFLDAKIIFVYWYLFSLGLGPRIENKIKTLFYLWKWSPVHKKKLQHFWFHSFSFAFSICLSLRFKNDCNLNVEHKRIV